MNTNTSKTGLVLKLAVLAAAVAGFAASASAAITYNISLGGSGTSRPMNPTASGGPAPDTGATWNDFSGAGASGSGLLNSQGGSSTVGFAISQYKDAPGDWGGTGILKLLGAGVHADAGHGGGWQPDPGTFPTLVISGLTTTRTYDLYLVTRDGGGCNNTFTVGGAINATDPANPLIVGGTTLNANNSAGNGSTWVENQNYVHFTALVPDSSGKITVLENTLGGRYCLNGFQLVDLQGISPAKDILTFTFPSLGAATITGTNIFLSVPWGTAVTNLAPTFTISPLATANPVSGTAGNFSSPVTYIVTAQDLSTKAYRVTVTILPKSSAKDILACNFGALGAALISGTNITMTVPMSQALTNLSPTFTISPLATLSPASGSTNDFTSPVNYTVTAQDGSTKVYKVTVLSYAAWSNSASLYILTTTNGAYLPASASEANFPLLVRLNNGNFNFSQAKPQGDDMRFSTGAGVPLSYQIEQWDSTNGAASVWVRIPSIAGNTAQEIKMYWGKPDAASESSGAAVFNAGNGYVTVMHLNETLQDEAGSVTPVNAGTTLSAGIIGKGRHITLGTGINCGDSVTNYPYANNPFTTEAWFRPELGGTYVVYWGRYPVRYTGNDGGNEVFINVGSGSPPTLGWGGDGGGGAGAATIPVLGQWYHVAGTYSNGTSRVFVNGKLDGSSSGGSMTEWISTNIQVQIGGMRGSYAYAGDVDEVRVSGVARSTNWVWLEYQNQNPLQTLLGAPVQPGTNFSVTPAAVTMNEGAVTNLVGQAGGAQKLYWIYKKNGQETVLAVDQFTLSFAAGRVVGDQSFVLQFKAVYPAGVKTNDIPVAIQESIPDPVYTLVPSTTPWDGRQTLTVTPNISNWSALQAKGVTNLNYTWRVNGVAVIAQSPPPAISTPGIVTTPGPLTLLRSQGSGPMTVTLVLDNGGTLITNTVVIPVQEPASDAWVVRTPGATETPVTGQFYARDNTGFGTIYYNGTLGGSLNSVFLKVYANGVLYTNISQALAGGAYAFSARIAAGLVTYSLQFGSVNGTTTNVLNTVTNLICGDAYLIDGQSNAVADSSDPPYAAYTSNWIRTYNGGWTLATVPWASSGEIGYWEMVLASNVVASYNIPICMINGAVGGTRIDQHQPNWTNHYVADSYGNNIYANLISRVAAAKLTHGIRGVLWHQGENNSGAAAPTGDWDYKSYQQYFVNMSAAWKQDMPNIQHYYIYQVWPLPCSMGPVGAQLREAQRTLPRLYSNMSIMSTVGILEPWNPARGNCHFDGGGYTQMANLMAPLVQQYSYGTVPTQPITAPDLKRAYYTTTNRNEIALEFGQDMVWNSAATVNFFLDKVGGKVGFGSASGNVIKLQLTGASTAQTIDYVDDNSWSGDVWNLLRGANGIAALTFADVPIAPAAVAPAITSLAPVSGRTNGGTVVTLTGSNFLSGVTVQFGGNSATAVTVNSSTQVTATTPAHGPGLVSVVVSNTNGLSATNQFTYVLPPPPAILGSLGQSGTNLVIVWVGGTNQPCALLSATNVAQPRSTWTPVATNAVGSDGRSTNTIPVKPNDRQRFYLLSIPYN